MQGTENDFGDQLGDDAADERRALINSVPSPLQADAPNVIRVNFHRRSPFLSGGRSDSSEAFGSGGASLN